MSEPSPEMITGKDSRADAISTQTRTIADRTLGIKPGKIQEMKACLAIFQCTKYCCLQANNLLINPGIITAHFGILQCFKMSVIKVTRVCI
jgi:hypothetical protein